MLATIIRFQQDMPVDLDDQFSKDEATIKSCSAVKTRDQPAYEETSRR